MTVYFNPPTVVVGVIPVLTIKSPRLLGIRRPDGKLALPGGYQEKETWQDALKREVREETGQSLATSYISVLDMETIHEGTMNILFATHPPIILRKEEFVDDGIEVLEVVVLNDADVARSQDWSFPTHYRQALRWFNDPPYEKIGLR